MTVSQLARLSGTSVRTLHHYDEIGLLRPSGRSNAGYRLYESRDLLRLQQVLFFRELDFPLEEIGKILDDPNFDLRQALQTQRQMLSERAARVQTLIGAVNATLRRLEQPQPNEGSAMTPNEMFAPWQEAKQYEEEAKQRWGQSQEYKESKRRTDRYTKTDWTEIMAEGNGIFAGLAKLMGTGVAPEDTQAMDLAEAHRMHISRWFYTCPQRNPPCPRQHVRRRWSLHGAL